jgi:hypothetical protein
MATHGEICVVFCYIQTLFGIVTTGNGSRWPRGLMREFTAARLLGLRVRIPPNHGRLSFERCVLSIRRLCDGPISRPEESYRMCVRHRV